MRQVIPNHPPLQGSTVGTPVQISDERSLVYPYLVLKNTAGDVHSPAIADMAEMEAAVCKTPKSRFPKIFKWRVSHSQALGKCQRLNPKSSRQRGR